MNVKMHEIKGSQLNYYRMSLSELDDEIVKRTRALKELRAFLKTTENEYVISSINALIGQTDSEVERMLEVYNTREENPSISDNEFLELALKTKRERSEYIKKHGRGRFKNAEEEAEWKRKNKIK